MRYKLEKPFVFIELIAEANRKFDPLEKDEHYLDQLSAFPQEYKIFKLCDYNQKKEIINQMKTAKTLIKYLTDIQDFMKNLSGVAFRNNIIYLQKNPQSLLSMKYIQSDE